MQLVWGQQHIFTSGMFSAFSSLFIYKLQVYSEC